MAEEITEQDGGLADRLAGAECGRLAAERRAAELEAQVACLSHGISSENIPDVIAIAASCGDCGIDEAVERVISKYPFFAAQKASALTTGIHLAPIEKDSSSGVEEAFRRANPTVKF